jgi:hypothetical protein
VRQRVQRAAHEVAQDGHRDDAGEERADVERGAHRLDVGARDPRWTSPWLTSARSAAAKRLRERRVRAAVARRAIVLGDDDGELVGPRAAAGALQPVVLRLDRRGEESSDANASRSWNAPAIASLSSRSAASGASARARFTTRETWPR